MTESSSFATCNLLDRSRIAPAMNVLANYASDSDSEDDAQPKEPVRNRTENNEDAFVLAALKDLQNFAASVQSESVGGHESIGTQDRRTGSIAETSVGSVDPAAEDDLKFRSFLDEINSIPYTSEDLSQPSSKTPPPPPPQSPPPEIPLSIPPPPPEDSSQPESNIRDRHIEATIRSIESVYSRLDHMSLLPSTSMDPKDMKRRLLEFAIRISDWKRGGLDDVYFLGKERAEAVAGHLQRSTATSDQDALPPFGGIVGAMVKLMQELEQMIVPYGWSCVWDAEDEAYGFQHIITGTYSSVYPSLELLHYLDPPAAPSRSPSIFRHGNNKSSYATRPSTSFSSVVKPSVPSQESPLDAVNTPPLTSGSDLTPNVMNMASSSASKKKKRKQDEEGDPFSDQNIHPSRRAALASRGGVPQSSVSAAGTSKTMPRKMASLLQKWNEKDLESSENEEESEDQEARNRRQSSSAITGANSQSLGNDWRDRRLNQR